MTREDIFKKFDKLYANDKGRLFFNHLIKSYFPMTNVGKVLSKPEGKFRCIITNHPLISVDEILMDLKGDNFKDNIDCYLKKIINGDITDNPLSGVMNGRKLGMTSKSTTTYISPLALDVFHDWIAVKMVMGDKHINWLLDGNNRSDFMDRARNVNDTEIQLKLNNIDKNTRKESTYSLGDMEILQELKKKWGK